MYENYPSMGKQTSRSKKIPEITREGESQETHIETHSN